MAITDSNNGYWLRNNNPFQTSLLDVPESPLGFFDNIPNLYKAPDKPGTTNSPYLFPGLPTKSLMDVKPYNPPVPPTMDTALATPNTYLQPGDYDPNEEVNMLNLKNSNIFFDKVNNRYASNDPYVQRLLNIESRGNPNAISPSGNHYGLYQIGPAYWKDYGNGKPITGNSLDPRFDPVANHQAMIKGTIAAANALTKAGVPLLPYLLYGYHNQGNNIISYYNNPNTVLTGRKYTNAIANMNGEAKKYYLAHPNELTGRAFLDHWKTRF